MALETQVNVQELQRLNDAIVVTMDSIRRLIPQLAHLQQQVPGAPLSSANPPYVTPFGHGVGYGYAVGAPLSSPLSPFAIPLSPSAAFSPIAPFFGVAAPWQASWPMLGSLHPFDLRAIDPMTAYVQAHAHAIRTMLAQTPTISTNGLSTFAPVAPLATIGQGQPFGVWPLSQALTAQLSPMVFSR